MKTFPTLPAAALWLLLLSGDAPAATRYREGDSVENFTLTDRATRQPVKLSDLAGKIVFLEWFAWWCPFCQAAAPQVDAGIARWYAERGGNPAGLPVIHVAVNLQGGQESQTQNFINRAAFGLVLEDFSRALANRFQSGGQPIFAIINGVTNSPSHRPWELLLHQDGYGTRDFSASIADFRATVDSVQAPLPPPAPPWITNIVRVAERELELSLTVEAGRRVVLESSTDFSAWTPGVMLTNPGPVQVRLPIEAGHRWFRARAE
ncbi:MAG: TlpA disulfide reductase family protein [Limisphaerales bacterium]